MSDDSTFTPGTDDLPEVRHATGAHQYGRYFEEFEVGQVFHPQLLRPPGWVQRVRDEDEAGEADAFRAASEADAAAAGDGLVPLGPGPPSRRLEPAPAEPWRLSAPCSTTLMFSFRRRFAAFDLPPIYMGCGGAASGLLR